MSKTNSKVVVSVLLLLAVSLSCKLLNRTTSRRKGPAIDFTTPGKSLDVKVQLDKKQTASGKVTPAGGSVSLTAADGSKFTLDVPANALTADTTISMTAVKSIDGAPLAEGAMAAVQLEPSGLFLKEMATLTIVPGKEMPVDKQIIFGYEGDGKDYHLALVDPKSKDIKIKLMEFSGAGVGSRSDSAWAANLMIQAGEASTRLWQKLGAAAQAERAAQFGIDPENESAFRDILESTLDQFEDQVVLKEMVAAELDCKFAQKAIEDLVLVERSRQMLNIYPGQPFMTKDFNGKLEKLSKIAKECPAPYRIVGGLSNWQTDTAVCDIMKPFTLTGILTMKFSGGLSGTKEYSGGPFGSDGTGTYTISLPEGIGKPGTMTSSVSGEVTVPVVARGTGVEKYTLTPIEPCK